MSEDQNLARARMEMQQTLRAINHETIHDIVSNLDIAALTPFFNLVAHARGLYIKRLIEIADKTDEGLPTGDQIRELSLLRRTFEELMAGGQVIETAIERGYINVSKK